MIVVSQLNAEMSLCSSMNTELFSFVEYLHLFKLSFYEFVVPTEHHFSVVYMMTGIFFG